MKLISEVRGEVVLVERARARFQQPAALCPGPDL